MTEETQPMITTDQAIRRWPRIIGHIVAASLGYATPRTAANILLAAKERRANHCEWLDHCWRGSAVDCVRWAIRWRHTHTGYMGSYKAARDIVERAITEGKHPQLASWF